ncbi:MAG: M20/M25/M40 family metallo-hydrolase [Nitrospinaceae bacterium]
MLCPVTQNLEIHLSALVKERNLYTAPGQLASAGRYICDQFHALDLRVREESVPFDGTHSPNILGLKEGTSPGEETFILAAHYDTVEGTPGADDNASAVAALLEIARCLDSSRLRVPLLFAAFTLEEYGFVGSRYFVERARERNERFQGMISLEMVGFRSREPGSQNYPPYVDPSEYPDTGDFIAVVGNQPSARLTHAIAEALGRTAPSLSVERLVVPGRGAGFPEVNLSDHSTFWENGTPAVMVTDTAFLRNPNYHQPSDTLDTLDLEFIRDLAQGISGFLEEHLG